jgi:hypothetical protein
MRNYFTNTEDISSEVGFIGPPKTPPVANPPLNSNRFNYGLPNMIFSGFSTFAQTQPASIVTEALALGNNSAWVHGSHDVRFGGDFRRIRLDLFGVSGWIFSAAPMLPGLWSSPVSSPRRWDRATTI